MSGDQNYVFPGGGAVYHSGVCGAGERCGFLCPDVAGITPASSIMLMRRHSAVATKPPSLTALDVHIHTHTALSGLAFRKQIPPGMVVFMQIIHRYYRSIRSILIVVL